MKTFRDRKLNIRTTLINFRDGHIDFEEAEKRLFKMMEDKPKLRVYPKVLENNGDVEDVFFNIDIVVDNQNNLMVMDRTKEDVNDFIDCNTLIVKNIKLRP